MKNVDAFYSTKHYDVVAVQSPLVDETREKYGILNTTTNVVEYYIDTFDNAMIAAETLSYIIENQTWKAQVEVNIASINRDSGAGAIAHDMKVPMAH
jgi:hypothetical protein